MPSPCGIMRIYATGPGARAELSSSTPIFIGAEQPVLSRFSPIRKTRKPVPSAPAARSTHCPCACGHQRLILCFLPTSDAPPAGTATMKWNCRPHTGTAVLHVRSSSVKTSAARVVERQSTCLQQSSKAPCRSSAACLTRGASCWRLDRLRTAGGAQTTCLQQSKEDPCRSSATCLTRTCLTATC